jgi:mercuric reductase
MWIKKLKIEGMTCSSCADNIENKLNMIEGVEIKVSYPESMAVLTVAGEPRLESLLEQITRLGFRVKELDDKTAESDECLASPRCC